MDEGRKRSDDAISDEIFCRQLSRLKQLHEFLYQEAVPVSSTNSEMLGIADLTGLHYSQEGRAPTFEEWGKVESRTRLVFLMLTPTLRRKFLMGGTPWMIAWLPIYFMAMAIVALAFAMVAMNAVDWPEYLIFFVYLAWLVSLGVIGACASVGMNVLSIQDDITFDVTNVRLLALRMTLGALFAVVLTLPFGYPEFLGFCRSIWKPSQFYNPTAGALTTQAIFLLLPFVLGFSTSLVMLVLNQLVEAVQAFFGRRPATVSAAPFPLMDSRSMDRGHHSSRDAMSVELGISNKGRTTAKNIGRPQNGGSKLEDGVMVTDEDVKR